MKGSKLYHQLTAFFFLAAFVTQLFSNGIMVIDYYTNTSLYASNCINKTKPALHCNGHCQLMKKLEAAEKKHQDAEKKLSENEITLFAPCPVSVINTPAATTLEPVMIPTFPQYHASMHVNALLRPPQYL